LLKKSVLDFSSAELRRWSAVRARQIDDFQSSIYGRAIPGPLQQAAETGFLQPAWEAARRRARREP
jgi:hypothetical protein